MKKYLLFIFLILLFIVACEEGIVGPSVEESTAIAVAQDEYDIKTIDKVALRHLTEEELEQISEDDKILTPVYFVIQGTNKNGKEITVFVNSNNEQVSYVGE